MKYELKNIKCVLSDIDGVLTDGRLYYGENGEQMKVFHALDGIAFKNLKRNGFITGVITAKNSKMNTIRMKELGLDIVCQGVQDKLKQCQSICQDYNLDLSNIAYIGDDLPDLELLKASGFSATVPHARPNIKEHCNFCTNTPAGMGAFREFADLIMMSCDE